MKRSSGTRAMSLYELVIPENEGTVRVLDFVRAHRTINVWINGLVEQNGSGKLHPTVKAERLWTCYDFYFTTQSGRRDFVQGGEEFRAGATAYSKVTFHSKLGPIEEDMNIHVYSPSGGERRHTVNLKQFIEENNIADTDEVDILIRFFDTGVEVTVPNWEEKPIVPGNK